MPSYMESFGRMAIEAMAAGAPVVAADVGGLGALVHDGETGWKVPSGDPEALAQALAQALSDTDKAARMAALARQRVERYSWRIS